ncbi:type II toxin-antitoxin system PemK/MazF family toxin [Microbacterium sp. A93]|uniref:type II toxin-antitoxin system PemK/MazF family toxin n=1 Tax=Microbacterium sp. A93 TaxID=3450716 RepID=UPI003F42DA0E
MALNLNQLWSVGRRVIRVARQVRRKSPSSSSPSTSSPSTPPQKHDAGRAPSGAQVTDYPGDFHGTAQVQYSPVAGPEAGPGEVVWTWVPFEELDGRGKDRPVLVVGRGGGYLLAAQLTSRDRTNQVSHDPDYIDIGSGVWDSKGRPSEVKLDRILQINPRDVRREGGVVDERTFEAVSTGLRERNGWS